MSVEDFVTPCQSIRAHATNGLTQPGHVQLSTPVETEEEDLEQEEEDDLDPQEEEGSECSADAEDSDDWEFEDDEPTIA